MTLKRFLVFIYYKYYPDGGMEDFKEDFNTVEEAKECVRNHEDSKDSWNNSNEFNQWHIYDIQEKRIVANHEYSDDYEKQLVADGGTLT